MVKFKTEHQSTWAVCFLFIVSLISFVVIPFSGDVEVFLGASRLADYYGKGLVYNSFNVWEIKGPFTRLFFYACYKLVGLLAPCPSFGFSILISMLYAVLVMLVAWLAARCLVSGKQDRVLLAVLICSAFFAIDTWSKMQAEETCALFTIAVLAISIKKGGHEHLRLVLSGMVISFMFWFKAPLLLLSISFAAAFMLLSDDDERTKIRKIIVVAASSAIFLVLTGMLVYFVNPEEYSRMLMASMYQGTLISGGSHSVLGILKRFVAHFLRSMVSIPVLYAGCACLIANFAKSVRDKKYREALYHFVLWAIPAAYVIISNCYFTYHFLTFLPAAMVEIWIMLDRKLDAFRAGNRWMLPVCGIAYLACVALSYVMKPILYYQHIDLIVEFIALAVLVALFFASMLDKGQRAVLLKAVPVLAVAIYFTYSAIFCQNSISYIDLTLQSYKNDFSLPLEENQKVLYLDAGDGAYYFGYDTFYEEYYPLILQRIDEGSERSTLPRYVDASEKILSYQGDFICLTEDFIFPNGKNPTLRKKINSEYEQYRVFDVYFTPQSIFTYQTRDSMHQLCLYKRKN